jgi:hypothetical protein
MNSLATAIGIVGVFAVIGFTVNTCVEGEAALKRACIEAGGSVITAPTNFHCVHGYRGDRQ